MNSQDVYRSCASIMIFRPNKEDQTMFDILLLHKPRKSDAWQLPQGGVEEGETVPQAALRELREEAAITAEVLCESSTDYQYDFPESFRRFRPDNVCGQKVKFVFAKAIEGQKVQVDENEIDGYIWVSIDQISDYIERDVYRELVEKMYEEGVQILKN